MRVARNPKLKLALDLYIKKWGNESAAKVNLEKTIIRLAEISTKYQQYILAQVNLEITEKAVKEFSDCWPEKLNDSDGAKIAIHINKLRVEREWLTIEGTFKDSLEPSKYKLVKEKLEIFIKKWKSESFASVYIDKSTQKIKEFLVKHLNYHLALINIEDAEKSANEFINCWVGESYGIEREKVRSHWVFLVAESDWKKVESKCDTYIKSEEFSNAKIELIDFIKKWDSESVVIPIIAKSNIKITKVLADHLSYNLALVDIEKAEKSANEFINCWVENSYNKERDQIRSHWIELKVESEWKKVESNYDSYIKKDEFSKAKIELIKFKNKWGAEPIASPFIQKSEIKIKDALGANLSKTLALVEIKSTEVAVESFLNCWSEKVYSEERERVNTHLEMLRIEKDWQTTIDDADKFVKEENFAFAKKNYDTYIGKWGKNLNATNRVADANKSVIKLKGIHKNEILSLSKVKDICDTSTMDMYIELWGNDNELKTNVAVKLYAELKQISEDGELIEIAKNYMTQNDLTYFIQYRDLLNNLITVENKISDFKKKGSWDKFWSKYPSSTGEAIKFFHKFQRPPFINDIPINLRQEISVVKLEFKTVTVNMPPGIFKKLQGWKNADPGLSITYPDNSKWLEQSGSKNLANFTDNFKGNEKYFYLKNEKVQEFTLNFFDEDIGSLFGYENMKIPIQNFIKSGSYSFTCKDGVYLSLTWEAN